jgi:Uma2 family endonuclease
MRGFTVDELQAPPFAPNVAVEILSPRDEPADVADKTATLLAAGSELVLLIDPDLRTFAAHDADGFTPFEGDAVFTHRALPGFEVRLRPFFSQALDLPF